LIPEKEKLRQLYEEEALIRPYALAQIYEDQAGEMSFGVPFWARYLLRLKQLWLEKALIEYAGKNVSVLDLGCGSGYLTGKIHSEKCRVYGVDLAFNYVSIAAGSCPVANFVQADIESLPFKDKSFDLVICSEVLEHLVNPSKALGEIKRVTKKTFISTVPLLPEWLDRLRLRVQKNKVLLPGKGHLRNFQFESYRRLLEIQGFSIIKTQGLGFLWWAFLWVFLDMRCAARIDARLSNFKINRSLLLGAGVIAKP